MTEPGWPGGSWAERVAGGVLWLASWIVPADRRAGWREEWDSEVWHHARGVRGERRAGVAVVARCLGAFPHAVWMRQEGTTMDSMAHDLRFALRALARRPVFSLVVVTTLALGIGGNTAVFSVVNSVLLRPLPLPEADRLVWVWGREFNGTPTASVSPSDYLEFRGSVDAFETLAAFSSFAERAVYRGGDRPVELTARMVTHDLLSTLGVEPALGRAFTEEETMAEVSEVIMLSHGLWGRLFGFDEEILGETVRFGPGDFTVVGVLPEGLTLPFDTDAWMPLTFGADWFQNRSSHFLRPLGRLREGSSIEDAQADMDVVAARLEAAYPETNTEWYPIAHDLRSVFVGSVRPALLILMTAIGLVLLIACANVAGLMLARSVSRRGEIAVRAALGASRRRVMRQLMTESLVLAALGGVAGVAVGHVGLWGLRALQPGNIPRMEEIGLHPTVLLFTAGLALLVGVVFGLIPARGLASGDVLAGLRGAGRGRVGGGSRVRSALVGAEVALSFLLLVGAGLLARSFVELQAVDPGFDPEGVIAVSVAFDETAAPAELVTALDEVLERVRSQPGVASVGAATVLPFSGLGGDTYVYAEGRPPAQIQNIENTALLRAVDEGYLETIGARLVSGRAFDRLDDADAPPRTVINEALAARLFPDESPIGQRMIAQLDSATALEIVGVMKDVLQFNLGTPATAEFFLPMRQNPVTGLSVLVRGQAATPSAEAIREAIWEVDPTQPLTRVASLEDMVGGTLAPGRFQALLLSLFSALAVGLAGIGIYGVLAESVNMRRREIGLRMAMGAQASTVVGEVVRKGATLALVGILVGGAAALGGTRLLSTLLYGVGPRDPVTFILTPLFLLVVVLLSSWLPARQAARIEPVRALREE